VSSAVILAISLSRLAPSIALSSVEAFSMSMMTSAGRSPNPIR
jgi:hypothetical protein